MPFASFVPGIRPAPSNKVSSMPRILFIVPVDYDALVAKGVKDMIFERDEDGFFERVVTVHPIADSTRTIMLSDVFVLYEICMNKTCGVMKHRLLRALYAPIHLLRVVWVTLGLVRKERIDLIRATDPFWIGFIALLVAKLSCRPWCVSIHADYDKIHQLTGGGETYTFFGLQWPARLVCHMVLSSADMVLPIRESLRQWAFANGARPERVRVIPHGIDSAALAAEAEHDPRALFGIPATQQMLSFVGRLSPENYLVDLLEVARRLAAYRDDFCLVIAGGGKLEGWLNEMLAADSRLDKVVRVVGFQPRGVCFALRRQSASSLCLMGGFSLIEACLAARPVIAYDVEWHRELVQTGRTGYLLPEGDIDGVVQAIERCLDDPLTATKQGQQARELALSRHELAVTSRTKKLYYEELLFHDKVAL